MTTASRLREWSEYSLALMGGFGQLSLNLPDYLPLPCSIFGVILVRSEKAKERIKLMPK